MHADKFKVPNCMTEATVTVPNMATQAVTPCGTSTIHTHLGLQLSLLFLYQEDDSRLK